ncbi:MAG: ABC transporter permease [Gammaproteobacteria bacterium]
MSRLWFDLKMTMRALVRSYGFVAIAVTVMALGVGATTFAFTAINGVVLTPLPYPEPEELVHIELASADEPNGFEIGLHDLADLGAQQTSFESLFAYYNGTVNVSGDEQPVRYDGIFVSANALEQIGVAPELGRVFVEGEDAPGAPLSVVIGWNLWQQDYGGTPAIVGTQVRVNGTPATIVGVMPRGFQWPVRNDIWVPMQQDLDALPRGEAITVEGFGRLREGVSLEQARAEFATLYAAILADNPDWNVGATTDLNEYRDEFVGNQTMGILSAMQVATFLVLLIACANVANLILARTVSRRRELSVRTALGASRWRLVAGTLSESILVSIAGGLIGISIAHAGGKAVERYLIESGDGFPYWMSFGADLRVAVFAIGIAALAGLIAGVVPALRAARSDVTEGLKAGGGGGTSVSLGKLTRTLITVEIALSCALLVGGALTVRSVVNLQYVSPGGDVTGVMTGRIGLFASDYPDEVSRRQFWERLEARVAEIPGVTATTVTTSIPTYGSGGNAYRLDGQEPSPDGRYPFTRTVVVTPGYLDTFKVPLLAGRDFSVTDNADAQPVALINKTFAERAFPGESAVGKRVLLGREGDLALTIVGVVGDVYHSNLDNDMMPAVYQPLAQTDARFMTIAARTPGDEAALAGPVREALRSVNPDLPIYWLQPAQVWVDQSRSGPRLLGMIFGVFGIAAVLLASVGVYGVLAFTVAQRTREFGVRRALGADNGRIVNLVVRQGAFQLLVGLPIGLILAFGLGQMLQGVLANVSSIDPVSFLGVPLLLALVVIAASFVPARRASRIDPMEALRHE